MAMTRANLRAGSSGAPAPEAGGGRAGRGQRIPLHSPPSEALDASRELAARNTPVALFLVDQRMPGMSGTDFLREVTPLHPSARRVLLSAYADTDVAIAGINAIGLDYYLVKPWDPPEQRLYPVLDDLLGEWRARVIPAFAGIRLLGSQWSPQSFVAKEFLSRNRVPYHWVDLDTDPAAPTVTRSTLGRADREDELADWLVGHDADEACAGPPAETGVTTEALDALAAIVDGEVLNATLEWMAAGCNVRTLAAEIESAAARLHDIVESVKGFTYVDHARLPEPTDVRQGILDTLAVLGGKARGKGIDVVLSLADDLPRVIAVGVELNQVWMNLIDNALDAAPANGRVEVCVTHELGSVVARIIDNGAGIPPDIAQHIFDPFFTTKGVGKGTELGLDIVRHLLQRHDAEIAVTSVPGRTEFQVRLPVPS
jgi:CheY-like chemotaxis protein